MAGLLDWMGTPEGQGLLAAVAGGMAGARRGAPVNSLGVAGLAGLAGYANAQDRQFSQQDRATQRKIQGLQLKRAERENANEEGLLGLQPQFFTPGTPANPGTEGINALMPEEMRTGAVMPATPATAPKFDVTGYTGAALSKGLMTPVQAAQLNAAMAKDTKVNKIDAKDFTPASMAKFSQSGNYGDLVRLDKLHFADTGGAIAGLDPFTGKPVGSAPKTGNPFSDLVLADGQGGVRPNSPLIGAKQSIAKSGASNVNNSVSVAGPENKYNADVGAGLAKDGLALVDAAKAAPAAVANAQQIRSALQNKAITGTAATTRLGVQKALETAGLVGPGKAASTEALMASLSTLTLDNIKSSGLGAGQGFTNADREFLASEKSGTLESTPENLLRVADLNERMARATHAKGKTVLGRWKNDPALRAVAQDTVLDELPEAPAENSPAAAPMATMPPANSSNKGRIIRDTSTGKTYRSDGMSWKAQ